MTLIEVMTTENPGKLQGSSTYLTSTEVSLKRGPRLTNPFLSLSYLPYKFSLGKGNIFFLFLFIFSLVGRGRGDHVRGVDIVLTEGVEGEGSEHGKVRKRWKHGRVAASFCPCAYPPYFVRRDLD